MSGIKQYLNDIFKAVTLEDNQKLPLIELLLVIGSLLAGFNLEKSWIWMYPLFALFSILYFIIIQKPIQNENQKHAILFVSFIIAVFFSGLLTGNIFLSIPKAQNLSPCLGWLYAILILLVFWLYFIFLTLILLVALKKD